MKLSVIVPVYNKERYLSLFFQQMREQSFQDYECLLIDDGSTDRSGELCDRIAKQDGRFIVFHQNNKGVSSARNLGIEKASGLYLTFVDSDDELAEDYLGHLAACMEESKADLTICGLEKFWEGDGNREKILTGHREGICIMEDLLDDFAVVQKHSGIYGCCTAKVFLRKLAEDIFFDENLRLSEDFDFYLRLYKKVRTVCISDYCGYYYRQNAEGSSSLTPDAQIDYVSQLRINLRYRDFLKEMGVYRGDNKVIVERQIADYVFYSLLYYPESNAIGRISEIRSICKNEHFVDRSNRFQKWLLKNLENNHIWAVAGGIKGYRLLRKLTGRK